MGCTEEEMNSEAKASCGAAEEVWINPVGGLGDMLIVSVSCSRLSGFFRNGAFTCCAGRATRTFSPAIRRSPPSATPRGAVK